MKQQGYCKSGLPYTRIGNGPNILVVFEGLTFEHKPQPPALVRMYSFLEQEYTIYSVLRRPHLPHGYTLDDMANDYALMIEQEFAGPVDIIGISTGGSVALHFAALHPELVHRLVLHSSAHALNEQAKQLQLDVARFASQGRWMKAWKTLIATMYPQSGWASYLSKPLVALAAFLLSLNHPKDSTDLVVTVESEDKHDFRDHLQKISCTTLVAGGEDDFFYSPDLFRETAEGIPNARLCLYAHMAHPAGGKQFKQDVLGFLQEKDPS
jgi:pimeloyl-ACP methyl ester carboxylesterase